MYVQMSSWACHAICSSNSVGMPTIDRALRFGSAVHALSSREGDWTCLVHIRFKITLSRKFSVQQQAPYPAIALNGVMPDLRTSAQKAALVSSVARHLEAMGLINSPLSGHVRAVCQALSLGPRQRRPAHAAGWLQLEARIRHALGQQQWLPLFHQLLVHKRAAKGCQHQIHRRWPCQA